MKDTIVGYTDEVGVTIPPLHPRCRCSIMYDEVETPRALKPRSFKFDIQRFGGQKLPEGDYNLTVRRQVQNRHIEGTQEYTDYSRKLEPTGFKPSKLSLDVDAQSLIREFHGKGIYDPNPKDGSAREQVDTNRIIGQYWNKDKNQYADTTWLKIVYSRRGAHVYPIFPTQKE